jgi:hypothetical protein
LLDQDAGDLPDTGLDDLVDLRRVDDQVLVGEQGPVDDGGLPFLADGSRAVRC